MKPLTSGLESQFSVVLSIRGTSGTSTTERTLKRTAPQYFDNLGARYLNHVEPNPLKTSTWTVTRVEFEARVAVLGVSLNVSRLLCGASTCALPAFPAPVDQTLRGHELII